MKGAPRGQTEVPRPPIALLRKSDYLIESALNLKKEDEGE